MLFAQVSPRSIGGVSLFDVAGSVEPEMVSNFMSESDVIQRAAGMLADAGFDVPQVTPYLINIAAPIATYDKAHRGGITGSGIRIAMVDSGHFAPPFFAARGYRVRPTTLGPGAVGPAVDDDGHGTAESANIFAVAPDVELWPVKINFANSTGAFSLRWASAPTSSLAVRSLRARVVSIMCFEICRRGQPSLGTRAV